MTTNTINTREEYLAYRTAWRAAYANTSQKIRETRTALVQAAKAGGDQSVHQRKLAILRDYARGQMAERTEVDAIKNERLALARAQKVAA